MKTESSMPMISHHSIPCGESVLQAKETIQLTDYNSIEVVAVTVGKLFLRRVAPNTPG